jgi:hypothetical protein
MGTAGSAQGFHIGMKGGANISKIDGQSFSDQFHWGYQLGGFSEINFTKKFGIQPEVLFSQTNTQTSSQFSDIYHVSLNELKDVKLNYLSIPILLNYRPSKLLTLQAGPQFSTLLSQDKTLLQNGEAAFKNGDMAILAGLQLNIGGFKIYGRYSWGISNINNIDSKDNWNNQAIQLGLGFRLF